MSPVSSSFALPLLLLLCLQCPTMGQSTGCVSLNNTFWPAQGGTVTTYVKLGVRVLSLSCLFPYFPQTKSNPHIFPPLIAVNIFIIIVIFLSFSVCVCVCVCVCV